MHETKRFSGDGYIYALQGFKGEKETPDGNVYYIFRATFLKRPEIDPRGTLSIQYMHTDLKRYIDQVANGQQSERVAGQSATIFAAKDVDNETKNPFKTIADSLFQLTKQKEDSPIEERIVIAAKSNKDIPTVIIFHMDVDTADKKLWAIFDQVTSQEKKKYGPVFSEGGISTSASATSNEGNRQDQKGSVSTAFELKQSAAPVFHVSSHWYSLVNVLYSHPPLIVCQIYKTKSQPPNTDKVTLDKFCQMAASYVEQDFNFNQFGGEIKTMCLAYPESPNFLKAIQKWIEKQSLFTLPLDGSALEIQEIDSNEFLTKLYSFVNSLENDAQLKDNEPLETPPTTQTQEPVQTNTTPEISLGDTSPIAIRHTENLTAKPAIHDMLPQSKIDFGDVSAETSTVETTSATEVGKDPQTTPRISTNKRNIDTSQNEVLAAESDEVQQTNPVGNAAQTNNSFFSLQEEITQSAFDSTSEILPIREMPTAIELGGQYYALIQAFTNGKTSVVFRTRRIPILPPDSSYRLYKPSAKTRQELISLAQRLTSQDQTLPDPKIGDQAALKIARPSYEEALSAEAETLLRAGGALLKIHYPMQTYPEDWIDFPAIVMEWVEGTKLSELAPLNEKDGLEVSHQLAEFLLGLMVMGLNIYPTDSLKSDGIFIQRERHGSYKVKVVDWNVIAQNPSSFTNKSLLRFGEVMVYALAPGLNFQVNRSNDTPDLKKLNEGPPDDPGIQQWDGLSYGTRNLIRQVLIREDFSETAREAARQLVERINNQRRRWQDPAPIEMAYQNKGIERLFFLDIAACKNIQLNEDDLNQLSELQYQDVTKLLSESRFNEALLVLRTAVRRQAKGALVSRLRWAFLITIILQEMASSRKEIEKVGRTRAMELLSNLAQGQFEQAKDNLTHLRALLEKNKIMDGDAGNACKALQQRLDLLNQANLALEQLHDSLDLFHAEQNLQYCNWLHKTSQELERTLLPLASPLHRDQECEQAIQELETALKNNQDLYRDFFPDDGDVRTAHQKQSEDRRTARFHSLISQAGQLADEHSDLEDLQTAWRLYLQAAINYPELWIRTDQAKNSRQALASRIATQFIERSLDLIQDNDTAGAWATVYQGLYYQPDHPHALLLVDTLKSLERGQSRLKAACITSSTCWAAAEDFRIAASEKQLASKATNLQTDASAIAKILDLAEKLQDTEHYTNIALIGLLIEANNALANHNQLLCRDDRMESLYNDAHSKLVSGIDKGLQELEENLQGALLKVDFLTRIRKYRSELEGKNVDQRHKKLIQILDSYLITNDAIIDCSNGNYAQAIKKIQALLDAEKINNKLSSGATRN